MIVALTLAAACASSQALTIDAEKYFAYFRIHNSQTQMTVLLSKKACSVKTLAGRGWKTGLYITPMYSDGLEACWAPDADDKSTLRICQVNPSFPQDENKVMCEPASKSAFTNTSSLPSEARF
jgi:hypothetical protein